MKIDTFTESLNDKYVFKTKEQLDTMSKTEVEDYRHKIVQNNIGWVPKDPKKLSILRQVQKDWKQYTDEIDAYLLVRFKQDEFDKYDKWIKQDAESDPNDHSTDTKTVRLLSEILNRENGKELMFSVSLSSDLKKIRGEFKYIFGVEIDKTAFPDIFKYKKIIV
jgi:hypothetical protein